MTKPEVGWWLRFGEKCTGTLQEANNIPQLCCTADEPPCAWCVSCGGIYPWEIGRKYNQDHWSNFKMLPKTCYIGSGFVETSVEGSLCCRNERQCKFCDGACNGKYSQVGNIVDRNDRGYWGVWANMACSEELKGGPNAFATANVNLCCLD